MITATTGFWPKSGSRIPKLIFCKKKQQITRDGIIFKNTIGNDVNIFRPVTAPPWLCNLRAGNVLLRERFWRENVRLHIYSHPQTSGLPEDIILIHIRYILNWMIISRYSLISWSFCNWATYPADIFVNISTLVYFSSKVIVLIIKSHDKYQSIILIGLTHAEKASSGNRSVLVHYRSYWREW